MMDPQARIARFAERWGPKEIGPDWHVFLFELRDLLEYYAIAALTHQSLPDTEHEHGQPIERKEKDP